MEKYDFVVTTYDVCMATTRKYGYDEKCFIRNANNTIHAIRHAPARISNVKGARLLYHTKWPAIFSDESHRFRNPKSKLFYAMMALDADERWCLSGTPIINFEHDIYALLKFCGYDGAETSSDFSRSRFDREKLDLNIMKVTVEDAGVTLTDRINHTINHVFKGENEQEFYDLFLHGAQEKWRKLIEMGGSTYVDMFTLLIRLRQICIAPYLVTKESKGKTSKQSVESEIVVNIKSKYPKFAEWLFDKHGSAGFGSTRVQRVVQTIKRIGKEQSVIFSTFASALHLIKEAMDYFLPEKKCVVIDGSIKGNERNDLIEQYRTGKIDVLLMTYQVGSEGHTLIECHNVLLLNWWWNLEVMKQAIARCHRPGQQSDVNVYFFEVDASVETRMKEVCNLKQDMISGFMSDVQTVQKPRKINMMTIGRIIGSVH
jgi:SNF2 family DNA or RNA helicase